MQGEKARLTITSPPYNLGRNATLSQNRFRKESKYLDNNDGSDAANNPGTGFRNPDGSFEVVGTDRRIGLLELARHKPFEGDAQFADKIESFPTGVMVCEVEIDPETGAARVDRLTAVADAGVVVNPRLIEGQVHGGLVQGLGQALMENCVYDKDSGQLLTGSFMDYAMPRADDFPTFNIGHVCTPCTHNPLGTKGCGEAGAIGSPPALMNAVLDALSALGVKDLDMPASPNRVWQAIQAARH